jgi:SAM-dependent methyltransferase
MDESTSPVVQHYDGLAENWETIASGPGKEHILFPALKSLLPDLKGKAVLDAGCGDGLYSKWLAEQGSAVFGIDISQEMISVARDRHGDVAEFECADLTEEIPADANSVDLVVCQHVLSHLPSLSDPFKEFARVLRPDGTLVLSTHHPFHDFLVTREKEHPSTYEALDEDLDPLVETETSPPAYHETEQYQVYWGGDPDGIPGTYHRRPLSQLLQPLLDAGLALEEVTEPTPDETFRSEYPDIAAELDHRPSRSICLRATPR